MEQVCTAPRRMANLLPWAGAKTGGQFQWAETIQGEIEIFKMGKKRTERGATLFSQHEGNNSPCMHWLGCLSQCGLDPPLPDSQWECLVRSSCFCLHIWFSAGLYSPLSQQQTQRGRPEYWHIWRHLWFQPTPSTWEGVVVLVLLLWVDELSYLISVFLALKDQGRPFQSAQLRRMALNADSWPQRWWEYFPDKQREPWSTLSMISSKGPWNVLFFLKMRVKVFRTVSKPWDLQQSAQVTRRINLIYRSKLTINKQRWYNMIHKIMPAYL